MKEPAEFSEQPIHRRVQKRQKQACQSVPASPADCSMQQREPASDSSAKPIASCGNADEAALLSVCTLQGKGRRKKTSGRIQAEAAER